MLFKDINKKEILTLYWYKFQNKEEIPKSGSWTSEYLQYLDEVAKRLTSAFYRVMGLME